MNAERKETRSGVYSESSEEDSLLGGAVVLNWIRWMDAAEALKPV
jgi:hypothetical protein